MTSRLSSEAVHRAFGGKYCIPLQLAEFGSLASVYTAAVTSPPGVSVSRLANYHLAVLSCVRTSVVAASLRC